MVKKIGVIAEDKSDIEVINEILEKYVQAKSFKIKKFVGNGCGKLRNKCSVWAKQLAAEGCEHIFLFHDLDRNSLVELRKTLEQKIPVSMFPNSLIVIPVEEIEAWLLADESAIQRVFNMKNKLVRVNNCEQVGSPKEYIKALVWKNSKKKYLHTIHNRKIANLAVLDNLKRCSSFKEFDRYITNRIVG